MNTCLIHMQSYPLQAFCPYCGPPLVTTSTGWVPDYSALAPRIEPNGDVTVGALVVGNVHYGGIT